MKKMSRNLLMKIYTLIRKTPIFMRLLSGFLIVILITGIFMTNYIYKETESQFYTTGINYIYENLDNTVQRTYNKLRSYENQIENLLADSSFIASLSGNTSDGLSTEEYLDKWAASMDIESLFVVTDHQYWAADRGIEFVDIDKFRTSRIYQETVGKVERTRWFNTLKENDVYYANSQKNSYLGNYITLTGKIGKDDGIVAAVMDIARISGLASTNKLYSQDLFLTDSQGMMTYLSSDYTYRNYPQNVFLRTIENGDGLYETDIDGKQAIFVPQKLGRGDWCVVSVVLKDNLLKSSHKVQRVILMISVAAIAVSLVICFIVTLSISYPINRLKRAMSEYAQKDFYTEYKDTGNDQIAQASGIFQSMVKRIRLLAKAQVQAQEKIGEARLKQKEMYLSALQMQINPHFLYNMLDLIRWNIVRLENGNGRISRMISGFSGMLRYNIKLGDTYAKLEDELEYALKYLKLLELLYDKKINLEVKCIDDEVKQCLVAKLLLQPVIENTITHGRIHTLDNPVIKIFIENKDGQVRICVLNNGKIVGGEKAEQMNNVFKENSNDYARVGLGNVNRRIKLLFGEDYGLLISVRDSMTCVTMMLPLVYSDEKRENDDTL